jgi:hypothetical protein
MRTRLAADECRWWIERGTLEQQQVAQGILLLLTGEVMVN